MSREDPPRFGDRGHPRTFCDLTQSWSAVGGGVGTYLRRKRAHILAHTPHRHLLIIPGDVDEVIEEGRAITATVASPRVPGSPNYRLLLRNRAVRQLLAQFAPDVIECQDAYNLPWAAIGHARRHPGTALVAAYCTDFPTVYAARPIGRVLGERIGAAAARLCYRYCANLYGRFDSVYAMSENGGAAKLRALGIDADVIPLGVDLADFSAALRNSELRRAIGVTDAQPLLVYAGRLDVEKRADLVIDAFERLPTELGARLMLVGDGPLRAEIEARGNPRVHLAGFVSERSRLATLLASSDVYVSGMADETFGISIVEAQASGLPVVGVAAGAMLDRVDAGTGRLGPAGDADAMTANILALIGGDLTAMRRAALDEAARYDWHLSMEQLFDRLYPVALQRASARARAANSADSVLVNA